MTDLDVLASWLQDRWAEDAGVALRALEAPSQPSPAVGTWTVISPPRGEVAMNGAFRLAEVESKRALLADLMAEGHHCIGAILRPGTDCTCDRDGRILRRLRILARPYAGRDDMPAELREP